MLLSYKTDANKVLDGFSVRATLSAITAAYGPAKTNEIKIS
jgi:hypothetical protein